MKYYIINLIVLSLVWSVFSGCVTKPKAIDDIYLSEIIQGDAEKLRKIEEKIVALKKDKDKTKNDLVVAEQGIVVSESEISLIAATNDYLQEKEKLHSLTAENDKLVRVQDNLKKSEQENNEAKDRLKLNEAKRDETEALLDVKEAELAVKVAELDYEKAKVAKGYQSKRPEKFDKDKIVDETEYEKFLNDQIDNLEKRKVEHKEAVQIVEKLKSGKEVPK